MRIAFVVPRYGPDIIGGAETAARLLAEHLVSVKGWQVDVLTTCAEDFVTWDDVYPPGEEWIAGVRVVRIPSASGREPSFHPLSAALLADPGAASSEEAGRWLDLQGPVSPDLAEAAMRMELHAVIGDDAGRFLAAMLQRMQPECRQRSGLGMTEHAEYAAFVVEMIVV